jgi:hypothetical protein
MTPQIESNRIQLLRKQLKSALERGVPRWLQHTTMHCCVELDRVSDFPDGPEARRECARAETLLEILGAVAQ